MSTYYFFYLGYKDDDGVFRGLGPYEKTKEGKFEIAPLYDCTRTYSGRIDDDFVFTENKEQIGKEIEKISTYHGFLSEKNYTKLYYITYRELCSLASGGGVRTGFVDKDMVNAYELNKQNGDYTPFCEYEFECLSPLVYANLTPEEQKDYVYYTWFDYYSKDYLASQILTVAEQMRTTNADVDSPHDDDNLYIFMYIS